MQTNTKENSSGVIKQQKGRKTNRKQQNAILKFYLISNYITLQ